jgi:hypothetical protein
MNSFPEVLLDVPVTLAAGFRNVEMVDRRFFVIWCQYPVSGSTGRMTVIAGRSRIYPTHRCFAVDAALVYLHGMAIQDFMLRGEVEIFVAATASLRQIQWAYARCLLRRRQNVMFPVTTAACWYIISVGNTETPMRHVDIRFALMTLIATNGWQIVFVRKIRYALVAFEARKAIMNGKAEGAVDSPLLAIRNCIVTLEAILVVYCQIAAFGNTVQKQHRDAIENR